MGTKKHSGILQRLEARSADSYEKVASRMRLAIKIADAIEHSGMSKKEFAIRLGKQPSEISKWLSGTHNFTMDTLIDISRVLKIQLVDDQLKAPTMTSDITVDTYNSRIASIKIRPTQKVLGAISLDTSVGYKSVIYNNHIATPCYGFV